MTQLTRALFAANALAACTPDNNPVSEPGPREFAVVGRDVSITTSDDAETQRFYVIIHSLSDRDMCFDQIAWGQGQMRFGGDTVALIDGAGARHPVPGSDQVFAAPSRLAPGATVRSEVGYERLPAAALAVPGPRGLLLSDQPYFCESGAPQ